MKKFLLLFFALLSFVISAQAQTYFEVDGIRYRVWQEPWEENPGEVYVAKSSDEMAEYSGDITIPASVVYTKTYKVTGIESDAFKECSGLTSVTIPDGVINIDWETFKDCTSLTSVTIPNSVTSIGYNAFYGCSKLTSVTLSNQLTRIEGGIFHDCTSLSSIIIPIGVKEIGNDAFYGCTSLSSITIPDGVTKIEGGAFGGCTSLTSVEIPNSVKTISGSVFNGCTSLVSVTIPNSVTKIENSAFSGCTSLTSIEIPTSVTKIEGSAFSGCTSLTSIEIPTSVTKIENSTFSGCESLSSITIPDGVTKIEGNAFSGCKSLTSIIIPNSVTSIGEYAFNGCTSLSSITIPNSVITVGEWAFAGCSKLTDVTLSDQLTTLEGSLFEGCTSLTSITIPDGVTSFGRSVFWNCTSLSSITIPSGVTTFGEYVFNGCNSLKLVISKLLVPFEVTVFDNSWNSVLVVPKDTRTAYKEVNGWKNFAMIFEEGEKIYTFEQTDAQGVKYSLKQAEDYSAYYSVMGHTEALKTEIVIPASIDDCPVKAILGSAFSGTSLAKITIPNSVTSIENYAFGNCTSLKVVTSEIKEPFDMDGFDWTAYQNAILVVPKGLISAYKEKNGWKNFSIIVEEGQSTYDVPKEQTDAQGLKYTLSQADDGSICYSVTGFTDELKAEIVIPVDLNGCPVKAIENYALNSNKTLTKITIPSSVANIGSGAFDGCRNLDEIFVVVMDNSDICKNHILGALPRNPIGYDNNGTYAEKHYDLYLIDRDGNEITEFIIPEGTISLVDGAFKGWSGLSSITIPNSVTTIGDMAFYGCNNLISVKMGKNVSSIGDKAFSNCTSLNSISLPKKLESIGKGAFSSDYWVDSYGYIGCPITSINIPGTVKTIGDEAFSYCRDLALVSFEVDEDGNSNLTSIGDYAFRECSFTSIAIPNTLTTIGKGAFIGNGKLTTATLGDAVKEIGDEAFERCDALTSIIIPDGVTSIGKQAFRWCYKLSSVRISTSLTSMGELAFEGCPLKSIELPDAFTTISDNLFKNNDFEYIKLGNNVKSIGKNAFGSKLEGEETILVLEIGTSTPPTISKDAFPNLDLAEINVIVPDAKAEKAYRNVSVWNEMTYANMENSAEVTVETPGKLSSAISLQCGLMPAKVVNLKVKGAINDKDFDQMRVNMKSLLGLDLSECDITEIPEGAMYGKTQLQELTLPTKLQTIGNKAFMDCPYLTGKLELPSGVTSIGNSAFEGTNYTSVTLPNKLQIIGSLAFHNLPIKQKLNLPTTLTSIGDDAFADTQVSGYVEIPNGITYLGNGAFRNTQIESTALPDNPNGITSISWGLFQGCTNFKPYPLYIPGTYTRVEAYAFDGCSSLETVRMSPNLVSLGEYAFQNTHVEFLKVPSNVEILPDGVFKNCKSLESLSLPANLKTVGSEALRGCNALRNLSIEAIEPPAIERSSMIGVNTDLCLISIPTASFEDYLLAEYWGQFVQMRNDIAVETEGNGEIAFESVEEGEEGSEALTRGQRFAAARAKTRGATDDDVQMTVANNGSSIYVPKGGKVRFIIIPAEAEVIQSATLDGEDITSLIDENGIYTTTADKKNAKLVVKFSGAGETGQATEPITIGKSGKASYCGDKSLDFSFSEEVKAYIATGFDESEGTIWLTRVKDVPAGTPVMIKGVAEKTYNVPVTNSQNSYYKNMFKGNTSGDKIQVPETENGYVNYYLSGDGTFKSVKNYANIGNNKSYLQLPGTFKPAEVGGNQAVTIKSVGKTSYAAPVDLDFTNVQGLKAFTATGYDKSTKTIWLTRVMKVQKGEGVLLKGDEGDYQIPSAAVQSSYMNMFVGNTSGDKIQVQETSADGSMTNFYLKGDGTFVSVNGYVNLGNNKCYLELPTSMVSVASTRGTEKSYKFEEPEVIKLPISFRSIDNDGDGTTAIHETMQSLKEDGVYYTLQGQRVEKPGKGIYIKNGKKVVIK